MQRVVKDLAQLDIDLRGLQSAGVTFALDVIPWSIEKLVGIEAQDVESHIARTRIADDLLVFLFLRVCPLFGKVFPYAGLECLDRVGDREGHR